MFVRQIAVHFPTEIAEYRLQRKTGGTKTILMTEPKCRQGERGENELSTAGTVITCYSRSAPVADEFNGSLFLLYVGPFILPPPSFIVQL